MADVPGTFRAFVVDRPEGGPFSRGLRDLAQDDLPPGEVTVRVEWSSVNFKDGLAAREDGHVARSYPLVPGIDLAGTVASSTDPAVPVGSRVLANGYEIGTARHGGFATFARIPSGWVVPTPDGLTARDAMAIGTAGFTAAMSVAALEDRGLRAGGGPVLVTGASGGVGSAAIAILAQRGHEVWAATGKPGEHDRLRDLGATGFLTRDEVTAPGRPLDSARWAGAVDTVGTATLPYVLRTLRIGAAVASSGNASGAELVTTVFPFILRGVALLGMDSANMPIEPRRVLWRRLATDLLPRGIADGITEVRLDTLEPALDAIVNGEARGRWVVRVAV
jgi:putative YhdH/YhfP family quinone oxidoreductase